MKTLFSVPGALAGLLGASALFAQGPGDPYQLSTYRPGATYYAQPSAAPQAWPLPGSNVSFSPEGQAAVEQNNGDQEYLDALEGRGAGELAPPTIPQLDQPLPISADCAENDTCGTYDMIGEDYFCQPCHQWFVYGGGLIMNRNRENELWLSYDSGDYGRRLPGSYGASMDWTGGYEIRLGRRIGMSNWNWEAAFWAVRDKGESSVTNSGLTGNLNTPLEHNFQGLSYNPGGGLQNLDDFFNDAEIHRLQRSFDFYNVELNLFQDPTLFAYHTGHHNFSVGALGGIRFFRFSEGMTFSADTTDAAFNGDATEVHYGIDVDNNLIGPQVGFIGNWNYGRWNTHLGTKLGLYGNHIKHRSRVYGSEGTAVINNALSPNNGREYDVNATRGRVSFLGEFDLGTTYQVTQRFSLTGGYRVVAVTGVALSTEQVPQNFEDLEIVHSTPSNGDVILHGAYFGGEFVW